MILLERGPAVGCSYNRPERGKLQKRMSRQKESVASSEGRESDAIRGRQTKKGKKHGKGGFMKMQEGPCCRARSRTVD